VPFAVDAGEASDLGMGSMEHLRNVELATAADAESLLSDRRHRLIEDQHLHGGDLRSAIHRAQRGRALDAQSEDSRDELLARFARNGTAQVPTLVIMAGSRIQMNADPAWMALLKQMPASMRASWEQTHARLSGMSAEEWEPFHRYADWLLETTRLAYSGRNAGIRAVAGTGG